MSSPNRNRRKKGVPHTHAILLPGRPPARSWAGPAPESPGSGQPRTAVRAICCSGGGIRSAAFSLGALQRLNQPAATGRSIYSDTDFVTSVSGGGYIAASYALLRHAAPPEDDTHGGALDGSDPIYSPGSIEDNRLRAHTRYLVDSRTQLAFSLMGILYGLLLNVLAVLAAILVLATALGRALGDQGLSVLTREGTHWHAHFPPGLSYTLLGIAIAGGLTYLTYRLIDGYRPLADDATKRWCGTALALLCSAGLGWALFIGVPLLLVGLNNAPVQFHRASAGMQTGTLAGTLVALAALVKQVLLSYQNLSKHESALKGATSKARSMSNRIGTRALPWLGSALVVLILLVCLLTWVSNMATPHGNHNLQLWLATGALVLLFSWPAITDCNDTSLHRYYAQRLATAFAVLPNGQQDRAQESFHKYDQDKPALVVCAAVNTDQPGGTPSGRNCAPFTFSPHFCGISSGTMFGPEDEDTFDLGTREEGGQDRQDWMTARRQIRRRPGFGLFMPTMRFETQAQALLRDLVAVSAAAISPAMGRMSRPSLRLVLAMANVRLGMWLPNPLRTEPHGWRDRYRSRFRRPGLPELWREIAGGMTLHTRWVYVTDGGHYENLGLVEALRRGATEIFVLDASGDTPFSLSTFGEAVETARADLGVEIRFNSADDDPLGIRPDVTISGRPVAKALAATATATYANGVQATIYLCKAAFVAGLPKDIASWAAIHPAFPNDSTGNQLYGDREFEAYRQLGYEAAIKACELRAGDSPAAVTVTPPVTTMTPAAVTVTTPVVTVTSPVVTVTQPAVPPVYVDQTLAPRPFYDRFVNAFIELIIRTLRRPNGSHILQAGQVRGGIPGSAGHIELGDATPPTGSH